MKETASKILSVGSLIVAMISIQSGAALAKHLFPEVGSMGAAALRLFFGAVIMVLILRPWRVKMDWKNLHYLILYGLALGGMNLLFYLSIERIPLGITVALEFTGPLLLTVFSSRTRLDFCWLLLAIVGLALLLPFNGLSEPLDKLGVFYGLAAGFGWMCYIIFGQKAGPYYGTQGAALGIIVAAILVVPFGFEQSHLALFLPDVLPLAILVGLLSTALPYTLEMIALIRLPTQTFGVLMSLEPVCAALSGLILLSENLSLLEWGAIALIVIASVGTTLTSHLRE